MLSGHQGPARRRRPRRIGPPGSFHSLGPFTHHTLDAARAVTVHVPFGYHPSKPRPLLVMFDGQNVFGDEGSFAGGWHTHEAVRRLVTDRYVAPVVVAVPNGGLRRAYELVPWRMNERGGGLDSHLEWLTGQVLPEVRARWSVPAGALGAVIGGSSLGGLAALYAHFRHPESFGGALCMSPSLFVGGGSIFEFVARQPRPMFSRVYLDCGANEAGGRMLPIARSMAWELARRGYGPGQLMWREDRRGGHNERHWRRRLPKALRFMFRR